MPIYDETSQASMNLRRLRKLKMLCSIQRKWKVIVGVTSLLVTCVTLYIIAQSILLDTCRPSTFALTSALAARPASRHSAPLGANYVIQKNVFYVWCGSRRYFEFADYLSVLSVIHFTQPDNIYFYYASWPTVDRYNYNTWLAEIQDSYPFFRAIRVWSACDSTRRPKDSFLRAELCDKGGVYVRERVVLTRPLHDFRTSPAGLRILGEESNETSVKMSAKGCKANEGGLTKQTSTVLRCADSSKYSSNNRTLCVIVNGNIFPKDIWEPDDPLGRLLRTVTYGKADLAVAVPDYAELIPNIGHVVWIGGGEMKFDFFLCVLSLLYVAEVETVYIHGEAPSGTYWNLLRNNPKIKVVARTLDHIYGNENAVGMFFGHKEHISDLCRVDVLLRYGGIYIDTDALAVSPLSRELRGYEAVISKDINTAVRTAFPDHVSNGVMASKPNSRFLRLFLESMKSYDVTDYHSIGIRQPYKIKERYPDSVHVDPHLQVLCFQSKCRPTWTQFYQNENVNQMTSDVLENWKNDTFAFHFTYPTPDEFVSPAALLSGAGMIADVGRYVLEKSRMLDYFRELQQQQQQQQ